MLQRYVALAVVVCLVTSASIMPADACGPRVRVTFAEASPDYFRIEFVAGPNRQLVSLSLDLATTRARAFVDTAYGPSANASDDVAKLTKAEGFTEGGNSGTLRFQSFPLGARFTYLVDLDVTNSTRGDPDHVALGEMRGGTSAAVLRTSDGRTETISGTFDDNGIAILGPKACV